MLKVSFRVFLLIVLLKIGFTLEEFVAMVALHSSNLRVVSVFRNLYQVLVSGKGFSFHLVLLLQVADFGIILLNLCTDTLGRLNRVLILHVKRSSEALKVVLSVHQVLNAHL